MSSKYLLLIPPSVFLVAKLPSILGFIRNAPSYVSVGREIYRNASWRTIIDLCIYKARLLASEHLETGLLSSSSTEHNLVYYDGPLKYSVRFPKKRGPCPYGLITTTGNRQGRFQSMDQTPFDVTEEVRVFAGPSHNFHGIPTTPKMLGYQNLTFHFRSGSVVTFDIGDVISPSLPRLKPGAEVSEK